MVFRLFSLLSIALFLGCAQAPKTHREIAAGGAERTVSVEGAVKIGDIPSSASNDLTNNDKRDIAKLPAEFNQHVEKWVDYFQGRGREHMRRYLSRSSRYLPKMKKILRDKGLPEDLVYIALIESGFNSTALSKASAVGYWQFIRGTGKRYGLAMNHYVDERRDFIKATEAAAGYLKALHSLFGSWYLAIASYNVGENRIKNLVMRYSERDFWKLAKFGRLPSETVNYVPKFLAARLIAKHPVKYGFTDVDYAPALDFQEVAHHKAVNLNSLASNLGVSRKIISGLNPAFKRGLIPKVGSRPVKVRVPTNIPVERVVAALRKASTKLFIAENKYKESGGYTKYRVRRGDTLGGIARRYRTTISKIKRANNMRGSRVYVGKRLKIPHRGTRVPAAVKRVLAKRTGETKYRVRRGDNLYTIARRFGVTVDAIRKRNKLTRRSLLHAGKTLVIPSNGKNATRKKKKSNSKMVHVVAPGDTLSRISKKYNVKLSSLIAANRMKPRSSLRTGTSLTIPQ